VCKIEEIGLEGLWGVIGGEKEKSYMLNAPHQGSFRHRKIGKTSGRTHQRQKDKNGWCLDEVKLGGGYYGQCHKQGRDELVGGEEGP